VFPVLISQVLVLGINPYLDLFDLVEERLRLDLKLAAPISLHQRIQVRALAEAEEHLVRISPIHDLKRIRNK